MGCCCLKNQKTLPTHKLDENTKNTSMIPLKSSTNPTSPIALDLQNTIKESKKRELTDVYNIKKVIGQGSFGFVRKGQHKNHPDLIVAIKSIDKSKIKNELRLLKREVTILQSIDHPNIIKLYETFDDAKYFHIVMEFCSGGELFEKIIELGGKINEKKTAVYMKKILRAVNHLHEVGVCHRDLKPENFVFENDSPDAELKIIDFGLSNKFGSKFKHIVKMESFVGTPYYIAPEVIKGDYGPKCDIWSVGVIMYVMLTGHVPFPGDTQVKIFKNIMKAKLKLENPIWDTISDAAKDLLKRLLVANPHQRLSAAEALNHHWFNDPSKQKLALDPNIILALRSYKPKSQMQRAALGIIVKYLSVDQIKDLRQAFYDIDVNQKGELNIHEIDEALNKCGINLPKTQLSELFRNLDYNGAGVINYSEFLSATLSSKIQLDEHMLWMAFKVFDKEDQGFITVDNIHEIMNKMGKHVTKDQVREILNEVDLQHDGVICFDEFKKMLSGAKI
ncbi:unnamed protein product [Blepharisma stoltei]|uniref:non-specific serine/threonine protein kinase n=1 Tax=Blepharisma stoltei TaxID=1481888 RepID=A0AAU9JB26_9CILI|nr:unnamed protein product [Blepharisma stoltei]